MLDFRPRNISESQAFFRFNMEKLKRIDERDLQLRLCKAELQEMRDSLRFVEFQFAKAQELGGELNGQLVIAQRNSESAQDTIATQESEIAAAKGEIALLRNTIADIESRSKSNEKKLNAEIEGLHGEIRAKDERFQAIFREKTDLEEKVDVFESELQAAVLHVQRLEDELTVRNKELSYLQVKLLGNSELQEGELEALCIRPDSADPKLTELHQLKTEKQHLLQLIRCSPQLHEFGELSEDSGGIRYFPLQRRCSRKHCPGSRTVMECEDWVPQEVYRLCEDFQLRYSHVLDPADFNVFMQGVNLAWRTREANRIRRLKRQATSVVKDLQRQLVMGTASPEDVWEVQQLKAQLREMIAARRREEAEYDVFRAIEVTNVAFSQDGESERDVENLHQVVRLEASKLLGVIHSAIEEQFESPENDTSTTIRHSQEWLMVLSR